MSGMREKDQADFDLETFVDLFDTAMSSDNPAVQRALKNLILISAMVNAQNDPSGLTKGPLRRVVEDMRHLSRRIEQLESAGAYRSTYTTKTTTGTGTPYTPNQTQWPNVLPGTIPPGTIIGGQSISGGSSNLAATSQIDVKVGNLLDKLELK